VFSILGISHCKEYRLGEHRWGELAGAVGYQQVIYSSCPVGVVEDIRVLSLK
jgi:hypothetical protein